MTLRQACTRGMPCWRIYGHKDVVAYYPGLVDAVRQIVQIQGHASLGGNLCNASPAADSIPRSSPGGPSVDPGRRTAHGGSRTVLHRPGRTVLQPDELLVAPCRSAGRQRRRLCAFYAPQRDGYCARARRVQPDAEGSRFIDGRGFRVAPTPLPVPGREHSGWAACGRRHDRAGQRWRRKRRRAADYGYARDGRVPAANVGVLVRRALETALCLPDRRPGERTIDSQSVSSRPSSTATRPTSCASRARACLKSSAMYWG